MHTKMRAPCVSYYFKGLVFAPQPAIVALPIFTSRQIDIRAVAKRQITFRVLSGEVGNERRKRRYPSPYRR